MTVTARMSPGDRAWTMNGGNVHSFEIAAVHVEADVCTGTEILYLERIEETYPWDRIRHVWYSERDVFISEAELLNTMMEYNMTC